MPFPSVKNAQYKLAYNNQQATNYAPLQIHCRVSFRGGRKGAFAPPWVLNAPPWILSAPHPFERTDIY